MLIVKLNGRPIASIDDYLAVKKSASPELGVEVEVMQKGQTKKFRLPVKKTAQTENAQPSETPQGDEQTPASEPARPNDSDEQPSEPQENGSNDAPIET